MTKTVITHPPHFAIRLTCSGPVAILTDSSGSTVEFPAPPEWVENARDVLLDAALAQVAAE